MSFKSACEDGSSSYRSSYGSSSYGSGYDSVYGSGYGSGYSSGYGSAPDSVFGSGYRSGYGSAPDSVYGSGYNSGYGSASDSVYGAGYSSGYGSPPDSVYGAGYHYGHLYARSLDSSSRCTLQPLFGFLQWDPYAAAIFAFQIIQILALITIFLGSVLPRTRISAGRNISRLFIGSLTIGALWIPLLFLTSVGIPLFVRQFWRFGIGIAYMPDIHPPGDARQVMLSYRVFDVLCTTTIYAGLFLLQKALGEEMRFNHHNWIRSAKDGGNGLELGNIGPQTPILTVPAPVEDQAYFSTSLQSGKTGWSPEHQSQQSTLYDRP
ncbi:MAG: hypothetical protein Q9168_004889 [Polycauliona sp. 1 TL-2023]